MNRELHTLIDEKISGVRDWDPESFEFDLPNSQFDNGELQDLNIATRFKAPNYEERRRIAHDLHGNQ